MFSRKLALLALLSCAASTLGAQTTTMDFSVLQPFNNYDPAPQSFGDHANLDVTNRSRATFGNSASACPYVEMWGVGYSSLTSSAFSCGNGLVGELYFQPGAGKMVTLSSLYLGSYPSTNGVGPARAMTVMVYDAGWNQLFNFTGSITASQQITPNISSAQGLYLQWGTDWDTGVNLIQTTVDDVIGTPPTTTAPEPATFVLVGAGLALTTIARRRRTVTR